MPFTSCNAFQAFPYLHTKGMTVTSLLASYSRYPELALSVPSTRDDASRKLLLLTVRMPEISLIKKAGLFVHPDVKDSREWRSSRFSIRPAS